MIGRRIAGVKQSQDISLVIVIVVYLLIVVEMLGDVYK